MEKVGYFSLGTCKVVQKVENILVRSTRMVGSILPCMVKQEEFVGGRLDLLLEMEIFTTSLLISLHLSPPSLPPPSLHSMELHKAQLDVSKGGAPAAPAGINPNAIPLAQLLKNPQALNALSSLTGLQGLTSLTSLLAPDSQTLAAAVAAAQAAQRQKVFTPKHRTSSSGISQQQSTSVATPSVANANGSSPKENKRNKFSPY